ncbi:homoserine O-acetyltransferase [Kordiimonas sp. SCSIO 12603]|uniref:homoserine O-acetyltransferase MetX n=1 Tax=Kordiimonas sp. SCSIO 12603 TaxID=2829596 RepID=UPI0021033C33|nr:homoserine O-acetyltransferase [Kordiimonas sp. SCSIO 12603]UTW58498.1 homoserine O-acetyltransferase [Kordiimonas sp. SCSIO 12603]
MNTSACNSASLFTESPLELDSGATLSPVNVGFETYGELNEDRSNAVLICHALTGDQYVASNHPITGKPGWWERIVGPGKLVDTNKYFVICSNVLGSCLGTTGPKEINPATEKPWGIDFPVITIRDMVKVQAALLDHLGVDTLFALIGGSMGGMQVLEWLTTFPERLHSAIALATAARHTAQNIALHEVGRQSVMADPNWNGGRYYETETKPDKGLSVARMTAHITYLSEDALTRKFGRNLQSRDAVTFGFDADFQVESYLRYQGSTFVDRFDANSYLYITRAMDYLDIAGRHDGRLADAFKNASHVRCCVISFSTDWLYPTAENKRIVHALNAAGVPVSFAEIESPHGHDAFLLEEPEMDQMIEGFISAAAKARGLSS